jgi:adenosine deaminase
MRPILATHVAHLMAQHVRYAEIMLSPTMFPSELDALIEAFHHWREWASELEQGYLQLEFIMVVPRTLTPDKLERDTETFVTLHREGLIVGIALVGIETGESIQRFAPSIMHWREAGLGIEIHAGEHSGPESIWDALEYGRPDRLGHGLAAFQDHELLDYIRHDNIHFEFCPTSNLRTGAAANIEQHPIGRARALGLNFSINTDNPGAFECSLQSEYQLLAETCSFSATDFMTVFHHALDARFQPHLRYLPRYCESIKSIET